uniref:RNA-directed DNA polymerase, eukaryota n=1 Tax=Tanacetum cinerariifolium TaxID=118510 RepID=A0A6L2L6V9_TANCI|nr:RNA-directed DNA polymerase, eukaryota [Tanacetum cinerariifolium]
MGDFNEVRNQEEIFGSIFNVQGAASFNSFISSGGLVEVPSEGYSFTWCHKSASKMSKLDRFLIYEGLMESCPNTSAIILDRHLSDHRPIVLREINFDYAPTPFRFYHYCLLNKLRQLKNEIHSWVKDNKEKNKNEKQNLKTRLADIDLSLDKDDVLKKFGFGDHWCHWIQSCLSSSRGSILVNESPTFEFQFHKGLKQGDPLSHFLFILVMESLHLSFQKVVNAGKWCDSNINTIVHVLECFFRASGLRINMHKSMIMGVAVENTKVTLAAANIGCMILKAPFNYLGVKVGGRMSRISFWDESTNKILSRLSKWKIIKLVNVRTR